MFAPRLSGAILGTNSPPAPLTRERIATLPKTQRSAWTHYLKRSEHQLQGDQAFLREEMRRHRIKTPVPAPAGKSLRGTVLNKPADWFGQPDARRIADIVVSFQTPAGGWSKNLNLTNHVRATGEHFAPDNESRLLTSSDFDTPGVVDWSYVGTFDNDATVFELRYLAKVISVVGPRETAPYRQSFLRGLDYILAAQYPNGGWPQVWPLQGGYHDAITYNDNAMINVMSLLGDVSNAGDEFAFVPVKTRRLAADSLQRGIRCLLATQISVGGSCTAWGQQHDALTLQPCSARNYEMPSQASGESAGIMEFLMQQPDPGPDEIATVRAAAAWFERTRIRGMAFKAVGNEGRQLVPAPVTDSVWARFYEIGTDRPIFGDRDKTIHDKVEEISFERRNGYGWYGGGPNRVIEHYQAWSKIHPHLTNP